MDVFVARCRCEKVELEAQGPILVHLVCYCDDCQAAGDLIDAMDGGRSGMGGDRGTPSVLFRKDRVRWVRGEELLTLHRVREKTHTDRLVASCCNSAMTQVHHNWWPHRGVKTERIVGACPPIEMRIFTRHAPEPRALPRDVPSHATVSPAFAAMLVREALAVRLKTLFRR